MTLWTVHPAIRCRPLLHSTLHQMAARFAGEVQLFERVLLPSVERMSEWVLNLPCPDTFHPGESPPLPGILASTLEESLHAPFWTGTSGQECCLRTLEVLIRKLHGAIVFWQVTPVGQVERERRWGGFSAGLARWCAHQGNHQVWLEPRGSETLSWQGEDHLAGRILAGETWLWLEQQSKEALYPVERSEVGTSAEERGMEWQVADRLLTQGLWDPRQKPGRIWQDAGLWYLLWPRVGEDLRRGLGAEGGTLPSESREMCLYWQTRGVLGHSPAEGIERWHPLLQRRVSAVCPSPLWQRWISEWFQTHASP
ncbi:hypothetical protein [Ferrovum myxofaciens]|uniref:Uncharacterized protein n=2 Tax=root TaxID=1 RepID=A0A8F3DY00_9PROT|nr:hypothetical protein [Ferrovum myxofaciens]NDU90478.1 hypothetical protein [Ferrovum sp.]KXW57794.1 hypothetical protein FEMY_16830 [Ferrovum myxofaciens]MBU6995542.1 hypothetical protein [Ferrovum myxofaciens]QKE39308.1 MAG: hypothetical protein HO273_11790 [Ferrovum myxofaciens]QKE41864.1 MAG: hypothetical protein HO274_11505 [Ferrovum myxofaciens]